MIVPEDTYGGLALASFFIQLYFARFFVKTNIYSNLLLKTARLRNRKADQLHFNMFKSLKKQYTTIIFARQKIKKRYLYNARFLFIGCTWGGGFFFVCPSSPLLLLVNSLPSLLAISTNV